MTHGAAKDIVERLRKQAGWHIDNQKMVTGPLLDEAADEIERLREALQAIADHFADVMDGPMIRGAGVEFKTGVESIPTIARARALLKEIG